MRAPCGAPVRVRLIACFSQLELVRHYHCAWPRRPQHASSRNTLQGKAVPLQRLGAHARAELRMGLNMHAVHSCRHKHDALAQSIKRAAAAEEHQ